jgi:hypothetical protein
MPTGSQGSPIPKHGFVSTSQAPKILEAMDFEGEYLDLQKARTNLAGRASQ